MTTIALLSLVVSLFVLIIIVELFCKQGEEICFQNESHTASAGSRTRIDCLEGNHANRYTADAYEKLSGMKKQREIFYILSFRRQECFLTFSK